MRVINYLILLSFFSCNAYSNEVKFLDKDAPAPYRGYLFDTDAEKDARRSVDLLEIAKERLSILERERDFQGQAMEVLNQRVDLYMKQSDVLSKQVIEQKDKSFWQDILFFGLGAGLTTAIVFGVNKASK